MTSRASVGLAILLAFLATGEAFNVGVKGTKCNTDPSKGEINDPCGSLYDGVCKGRYCACDIGTHEDKALGRCVPGEAKAGAGGDLFSDLPFDFPGGSSDPAAPAPAPQPQPPPQPQPQPPPQPQPGYPQPPPQPQPGYPQPPPHHPGQPHPQPPPHHPGQPHPGQRPGHPTQNTGGGDVGEKAGGGVGGILGLLLVGGLIYFCCCKDGKHKKAFQGLPFNRGGGGAVAVPMQQGAPIQQDAHFSSQHTYVPPGQPDAQYPPPQQPYPPAGVGYPTDPYGQPPQPGFVQPYPPAGMGPAPYAAQPYPPTGYPADGQQPPPYTQQYAPQGPPM